jgi:hypothetical protein
MSAPHGHLAQVAGLARGSAPRTVGTACHWEAVLGRVRRACSTPSHLLFPLLRTRLVRLVRKPPVEDLRAHTMIARLPQMRPSAISCWPNVMASDISMVAGLCWAGLGAPAHATARTRTANHRHHHHHHHHHNQHPTAPKSGT